MSAIGTALALAEFVPAIAKWFGGDDAEDTAEQVVNIAKQVTGIDDPDEATTFIKSDPKLRVEFQQAMSPVIISRLENETKQQAEINLTMRAELNSNDKFKSWWRPALGWVVTVNTGLLMSSIVFVIVYGVTQNPDVISQFITALSSLMGTITLIWSMALGVLGVNVKKRSDDKALAAGNKPEPSLMNLLIKKMVN